MIAIQGDVARDLDEKAALITWLLRSPSDVASRCREDTHLQPLVVVSLMSIALGGAAFGGVVGSFRGGSQIVYAALKIPMAMLLALVVCVPAFVALAAVLGRPWPLRTVIALTLAASARACLLLLAFAPLLWLAYDFGVGYHAAALAAAAAYGVAGLAAFSILVRGLGSGDGLILTIGAFAMVFFAVFGQTSWVMRPYLVRPRTVDVPFLRQTEGSFIDAIWTSLYSSMDIYEASDGRTPSSSAEQEVYRRATEHKPDRGRWRR